MEQKFERKKGAVLVSESVVASITANAVNEISGVSAICTGKRSLLKRVTGVGDPEGADIRIVFSGDVVGITLSIILRGGHKAVSVAEVIQSRVKEAVQEMTGLTVSRVNVIIAGIDFPD
ncbi:MAG: Asp23/Gls24 family envelope stress response protein [Oscillospiraceae bacterium]